MTETFLVILSKSAVSSKENRSFHYVNPNRFFLPFSIGQGTSKVSLVMPDFSFRINQQDLAWIKGEAGRKKRTFFQVTCDTYNNWPCKTHWAIFNTKFCSEKKLHSNHIDKSSGSIVVEIKLINFTKKIFEYFPWKSCQTLISMANIQK